MTGQDGDTAEYLRRSRERLRRRSAAWISLLLAPLVALSAVLKIFQEHDYPAGDIQNEPLFWIATGAFLCIIAAAAILVSIWELRKGEVELPPYRDSRDIEQR
jgi:hypothetical protein